MRSPKITHAGGPGSELRRIYTTQLHKWEAEFCNRDAIPRTILVSVANRPMPRGYLSVRARRPANYL
jgi:hypothetical protein